MTDKRGMAEFRFSVSIEGQVWGAFTECSLPIFDLETETVKEGGLNTFVHQLPGSLKPAKITVKNGMGFSKDLENWMLDILKGKISRKKITIIMYDTSGKAYLYVTLANAYPTKWTGPQLKSDSNLVAIQSVEFSGGEVTLEYK